MLYRYEIYTGEGEYTGKGFLTALRMLDINDAHIRRIASPFSRDLRFPIMTDKPNCTSLFTEYGRQTFAMDIEACHVTYENTCCVRDENTKLTMRRFDIPEEDIPPEYVLYEDEHQVLVDACFMDKLRQGGDYLVS